jgi:hypothetical protein
MKNVFKLIWLFEAINARVCGHKFIGGICMKNKLLLLGALIVAAAVVLPLAGCGTVPTSSEINYSNQGTFGQSVIIPGKDFETRGLIFTETVYQITDRGTINGDIFTYQALLKEAQRLGADAIINVTIDKRRENVTSGSRTNIQETWYGSALAIRYTNTLNWADTKWNDPSSGGSGGGGAATSNEGSGGLLGGLFGGR